MPQTIVIGECLWSPLPNMRMSAFHLRIISGHDAFSSSHFFRCGNVASILELDEHLAQEYKVFSHAPSVSPRSLPDYINILGFLSLPKGDMRGWPSVPIA